MQQISMSPPVPADQARAGEATRKLPVADMPICPPKITPSMKTLHMVLCLAPPFCGYRSFSPIITLATSPQEGRPEMAARGRLPRAKRLNAA